MEADALFEPVLHAFLADSRITKSKMFGSVGLKVDGKVFAMLYKGNFVVKLSRERAEALVASGAGVNFDPGHGRIMKEWVAFGPTSQDSWLDLAQEAKTFVDSG